MNPISSFPTGFLCLSLIAIALAHPLRAQWQRQTEASFNLNRIGRIVPSRAIIAEPFYSGSVGVFKGDSENDLVVQVRLVSIPQQDGTFRPPETPGKGLLFCEFYEKSPVGMTDDEKERVLISAELKAVQEVKHGDLVRFKVPDHAAHAAFRLRHDEVRTEDIAFHSVSRPYRTEAVRQIAEQRAREREKAAVKQGKQIQDVECARCKGRGKIEMPAEKVSCERCNGMGWYPPRQFGSREKCGQDTFAKRFGQQGCGGSGKLTKPAHDVPCESCNGTGKTRSIIENPLLKN